MTFFFARLLCLFGAILAFSTTASASTIVRFNTVLGNIDVRLFDAATPASVANFLNYVEDGDYEDSFFHRAPPGFVIQGGGFDFPEGGGVGNVPTDPPVVNEPGLTNLRGTLAYAKVGGDPNSATSGWFFNLSNNNANAPGGAQLDTQNGGFTVFGRVIRNGLQTVDAIASQQVVNAGGAFEQLPVLDSFTPPNIFRDDLVLVNSVTVLNFATGDYNFDGQVTSADYNVWRSQFGSSLRIADNSNQSLGTSMEADGNGDGVVDAIDYAVWREAFAAAGGGSLASFPIPEPCSAFLALLALSASYSRRR